MDDSPQILRCDAADVTIVVDCRRGHAELAYFGARLSATEKLTALCDAAMRGPHECQPDAPAPPSILPQSGWGYAGTPAIALARGGAMLPTRLSLIGAEASSACALRIAFADEANGVTAEVDWRISPSGLVIVETSIANTGTAPFEITTLATIALPLPVWATRVTRFAGRWAGEMHGETFAIPPGALGGASFGGRPGFGGANWVRFEEAWTGEVTGHALAAHLAWSGDVWQQVERDADGRTTLLMGARLDAGEVTLEPAARWTTPPAMVAVGTAGRAAVRQAFHAHVIGQVLPHAEPRGPRKVHLNSWEALGFDLEPDALRRLVDDAGALGVERFVLDDGWFAGRRGDTAGLGDWTADAERFPAGLTGLIDHVRQRGMDFGLWVEPEMVSPDSALYRRHPDWCLHIPGAPRPTQRNQLTLDLARPEVGEHIFTTLDALLRDHAIAYLKWDHNRALFPRAGRGHAQTTALYALLDRLRAAHPGVEIESCASGGGRVDLTILRRCARYWASDNNDAIERLRINRGWFDFLPLMATGNHVGPSPNPITGRRLAMDFRAKVAMFGHMGVEADPASMADDDRACLAAHIALYKVWRDLLHRAPLWAIGCADPGVAGWFAHDGVEGLAIAAQCSFATDFEAPPVRLFGLEASRSYRIRLLEPWPVRAARHIANPAAWRDGLTLSGRALAENGLALPLTHPETAWLIEVRAA